MNQPNRIDSWLLQDDEKPLTITEDPKIPNAATVLLRKQDHTLGNMIRAQLLLDPTVLFAGYKVPHPLENDIIIKIQCDERSNPADALKRACHLLIRQTVHIKQQFMDQAKNIEMGMGPDQQQNIPGQNSVYDPYSIDNSISNTQQSNNNIIVGGSQIRDPNNASQDVYDF